MSTELEEVPMRTVVALDVHRRQISYKTLGRGSGEVTGGPIAPATRGAVREWLERFAGCDGEFALEGTSGWRFVVEEIERAVSGRICPTRPRRPASGAASGGRRPITPTATCS
jgi:hypothetical protein